MGWIKEPGATAMEKDHVDRILTQWRTERPDLDVEPMGLLGRLARLATYLGREVEKTFLELGLTSASFDVLAALRRSGAPYQLSPGDLLATMMITSGTMTNRIDQLEKAGLVERLTNPEDRRSVLIALKPEGLDLVERAVTAHVANQHRLTALLEPDERVALDAILRKYLLAFE
jgi:DNA-binding MarR family transcriptional regulator